jgi:hypothetical protein
MADRAGYLARLAAEFYPELRREGFRGSTLRRRIGPIVHVVNVQGSQSGGRCYVNLGAHLDFLPVAGWREPDPGKILEYMCEFRSRLTPPGRLPGWPYGDSDDETSHSIDLLRDAFREQAVPFFAALGTYPDSFLAVAPSDFLGDRRPGPSSWCTSSLTFARIALHLGDRTRARAFAEVGLETVGPLATGLRATLERFLAGLDRG